MPLLGGAAAGQSFPADIGAVLGALCGEVQVVVFQLDLVDVADGVHRHQRDTGIRIIPRLRVDIAVSGVALSSRPVVVQRVSGVDAGDNLVIRAERLDGPVLRAGAGPLKCAHILIVVGCAAIHSKALASAAVREQDIALIQFIRHNEWPLSVLVLNAFT